MENELKQQKDSLFDLIETWELQNINLAKQLIKNNAALKVAVAQRYRGLLKLIGRKTIQSLLNLAEKLQTDKQLYRKQWYPDPEEQTILAKIPLKELDISSLRLSVFPEWLCSLKQLQQLRADHNRFDKLPESFCRLTKLKALYLNHNKLTKLPLLIGQLKQLNILQLKNNQLLNLPNSFGKLKNVVQIDLQSNKIAALPDSIGGLKAVAKLDLSKNKLKSLPPSFGQLLQLNKLYLHNNKLMKMRSFMGQLSQLKIWYIDRKSFQKIPESFLQLNLDELCIVSPSIDFPMTHIKGAKNIKIHLYFLLDGHSKNIDFNQL